MSNDAIALKKIVEIEPRTDAVMEIPPTGAKAYPKPEPSTAEKAKKTAVSICTCVYQPCDVCFTTCKESEQG